MDDEQISMDLDAGKDGAFGSKVTIHSDPYEAATGTHALVICTEWDEFIVRLHC